VGYEEKKPAAMPHGIVMEGRAKLSVSGVSDVGSFNEQEIVMETGEGRLTVRGDGLHMERLSVDSGDVAVTGRVDSLEYSSGAAQGDGFLARLFR